MNGITAGTTHACYAGGALFTSTSEAFSEIEAGTAGDCFIDKSIRSNIVAHQDQEERSCPPLKAASPEYHHVR